MISMSSSAEIPATVLTGYLGSGKTTLLNRILNAKPDLRIAVIENEAGEIGIDQDLVICSAESLISTSSGCACCAVRDDLVTAQLLPQAWRELADELGAVVARNLRE